jgi:hypothetical protein
MKCCKEHRRRLKELPMDKVENFEQKVNQILLDCSPKYKINIIVHVYINKLLNKLIKRRETLIFPCQRISTN